MFLFRNGHLPEDMATVNLSYLHMASGRRYNTREPLFLHSSETLWQE